MSLVKDAIKSLVETGKINHEFTMSNTKFVMEILSSEEQLIADGMVNPEKIIEKYKGAATINTYRDTIDKARSVSLAAFAIKLVNGVSPVDLKESLENQLKQRIEFRDELMGLDIVMQDQLTLEYRKLCEKQRVFLENVEENAGK